MFVLQLSIRYKTKRRCVKTKRKPINSIKMKGSDHTENTSTNVTETTGREVTGDTKGTNVMTTGTNVMTTGTNVTATGTNVTATETILTTTEENEMNGNSKLPRELDDGENCEIHITNDLVKRIDNYVCQIQPECIKPILENMKPLIIEVVSGTRKTWRHDVVTGKRIVAVCGGGGGEGAGAFDVIEVGRVYGARARPRNGKQPDKRNFK